MSDPFPIVNIPLLGFYEKVGPAHIKQVFWFFFSFFWHEFLWPTVQYRHTHTHTHTKGKVQSQESGLEVNVWPLGRRRHPDNAALLARLD